MTDIFFEFCRLLDCKSLTEDAKKMFLGSIHSIFERESRVTTFLHEAVAEGRIEIVDWLLENGANPNVRGTYGTPLHEALLSTYGETDIISILLKYGAKPNVYDNAGKTPIWYVIDNDRYSKCVQILLNHGAYVYKPNKYNPNEIPFNVASEKNKKVIDHYFGRE